MSDCVILERVLARWRSLVASLRARNLLNWVIPAVSYWRIVMAIKTASKVGVFFIIVLLIAALVDARAICSE
jgi:hypothetical protein